MGQRPAELTPRRSPQHFWGHELRALRLGNGLSLAELGKLVHRDRSYLAKIERGERPIPPDLAQDCDNALRAQGSLVRLHTLLDTDNQGVVPPSTHDWHVASHGLHVARESALPVGVTTTVHERSWPERASKPGKAREADPALETGPTPAAPASSATPNVKHPNDLLGHEPPQRPRQPALAAHDGADSVALVLETARSDVERRQFLEASSGYALSVLALPDPDSLTRHTRGSGPVNVGRGEVAAVRLMVQALGDAAAELGGGLARHLAVRYLTEDVALWLNGRYTEATGRDLFAATAQLVHLTGWMAADEGNQGMAQRYYAHSYRLATEAADPELAATALRGMAVQAITLGYRATAVHLSHACVHQARAIDNPRASAYYAATLANAAATDGDHRTAIKALADSQTAIERSPATAGPSWAAHYSPGRWAHEAGMILAQLGDLDAAQAHLNHALDIHGLDRRRSQAIVLADLGTIHLRRDDIPAALATWGKFIDCAQGIRSIKITNAIADMRARLAHIKHALGTHELDQRAANLH